MVVGINRTKVRRLLQTTRISMALSAIGAQRRPLTICVAASMVFLLAVPTTAAELQLITPTEAALPAGTVPTLDLRGSPTRRPMITVVSPPPGAGLVHSPLDLKLQFRAFGGVQIDPNSVVVTYLKDPAIDVTQRLAPYITAAGIDVPQADVPPGKHIFWLELKDKDGRIGGGQFSFQVTK
jgi:hypothetical protein